MLETLCETLLGSLLLLRLNGSYAFHRDVFVSELWRAFVVMALAFGWGTGYIISTAIVRTMWRSKRLWRYPSIASALFLGHLQWIFMITVGFSSLERLVLRGVGVCIVFTCTLAGNLLLRRWNSVGTDAP